MNHHPVVKVSNYPACGAFEQARDEPMNETHDGRHNQGYGEAERHPLMFEITLSDRTRMIEKPALKHDALRLHSAILLADSPNLFPNCPAKTALVGNLFDDVS